MQMWPQLNIAVQFNANSKKHVYVALFVFYVNRCVVMSRQTVCTYLKGLVHDNAHARRLSL